MSTWPTLPNWNDPALLNGGEKYNAADGVTASDFNKIVENLLYMEKYGIGGGSCAGKHVIEVDELPTEGIDVNAVYLCKGIYYTYSSYFYDTLVCESAVVISLRELYEEQGLAVYCHILPTMTTEGLIESDFFNGFHLYYIEDPQYENIYIYDGTTLMPLSIAFSYEDTVYTYGGTVSKTEEATKNMYYYAFFKNEWKAYQHVSGTIDIVENGTGIDVAGFERANVNVPIPTGYVKPEGEVNITEPGTYDVDVTNVKTAKVDISAGLNLNGVIKQYKVNAGASVNAGDFVEFVNKFGSGTVTNTTIASICACKLDNSRVLVAYTYVTNTSYDWRALDVAVLTLDNNQVSVGTPVQLTSSGAGKTGAIPVALTDSRAIVPAYGTSYAAAAYLLNINQSTIEKVGAVTFSDGANSSSAISKISLAALTDANALMICQKGSGVYFGVLTAGETSITYTQGSSGYSADKTTCCAATLNSENVLGFFTYTTPRVYLFAISGTSSSVKINSKKIHDSSATDIFGVALTENKALALWRNDSASGAGTACVVNVIDEAITVGTPAVFHSDSTKNISAITLNESKVLVTYQDATNSDDGEAVVLTVDGDTITVGEPVIYDDGAISGSSPVALAEDRALVAYLNNSKGLFTQLAIDGVTSTEDSAVGTFVQPATSNLYNVGVAKTAGTEGETVDVYRVQ